MTSACLVGSAALERIGTSILFTFKCDRWKHTSTKPWRRQLLFIQTSKMFCILSRISLPCRSPTTLSNNINNIWEVNSINLLLSWKSREQTVSVLLLFSVLPRAMVSTLVSVPWDLLSFVCCEQSCRICFLLTFFVQTGEHGRGGLTVWTLCVHSDVF